MSTIAGKGQFDVKPDLSKKRLYLIFDGFFNDENSTAFVEQYESAKKQMGQSDTTLMIDATNLKVFPPKLIEAAKFTYLDYTKFKEIYFIDPVDVSARMQLHRILKDASIEGKFNFVEKFPQ